ncbi:hypothetical protein OROGR_010790 [Orobanche gracilis]
MESVRLSTHLLFSFTVGERGVVRIWNSDGAVLLFERKSSDLAVSSKKEEVKRGFTSAIMQTAVSVPLVLLDRVPEKTKESAGGTWEFVGLLPLFDPPRHDSAETIRKALDLGVNMKMIIGDQLAIGKETGQRLGMGTNMYQGNF